MSDAAPSFSDSPQTTDSTVLVTESNCHSCSGDNELKNGGGGTSDSNTSGELGISER